MWLEIGWNAQVTTEQVLQVYRDFPRAVISLLAKSDAPGTPKGVWPLLDMEQIPWTKGRMALLGDAAHPFTPHQGQGAVQALEDAASLSVVLPAGTHLAAVPERLRLYERIRSKRAHTIQAYSREAGKDVAEGEKPEVNNTDELFSHDELYYSKRMFKRWKHEQDPTNFHFLPLAAGAFSGMRRALPIRDSSGFKRVTIKFKTSKPFMETLLPNDHFVFRRPDTVCTASLVTTSLSNLPWLGGEGYTTLALHIHGVQYKQIKGGVMNGSFVAIHLVSRGEAVAACREELGLPAVPCDLDVYQPDDNSCTVTASWEGAKFASLSLTGLVAKDAALERGSIGTLADYGVMSYRYVPAVGRPGEPEAEYACVTPHAREKTETVESVSSSTSARLVFKDLGWEQLPTLGHIAAAFSQMPIYGIVGVKVVEGSNASEQLSSRKID
ncbi:hypothetical protein MCOR25_010483 [Pyricularia grisea]|nr:hypothetical protein MCOR25_010483 [Pyricularia grisea]